jgi:hypothetical protein
MADPALPGGAAQLRHDIVTRPARGFVDDEQPVDHSATSTTNAD